METPESSREEENKKSSKVFISVSVGLLVTGVITVISISGARDKYLILALTGVGISISALGGCCLCCSFALQGSTNSSSNQQRGENIEVDPITGGRTQTTNQSRDRNQLTAHRSVTRQPIGHNLSHSHSGSQRDMHNGRHYTHVSYSVLTENGNMTQSSQNLSHRDSFDLPQRFNRTNRRGHSNSLSNLYMDSSGRISRNDFRRSGRMPDRGQHIGLSETAMPQAHSPPNSDFRRMEPPSYEVCAQDSAGLPSYEFVMSNRSYFNT